MWITHQSRILCVHFRLTAPVHPGGAMGVGLGDDVGAGVAVAAGVGLTGGVGVGTPGDGVLPDGSGVLSLSEAQPVARMIPQISNSHSRNILFVRIRLSFIHSERSEID